MSSLIRGLLLVGSLVFGAGCASTSSSPSAFTGDAMPHFITIHDDSRNETVPVQKADDKPEDRVRARPVVPGGALQDTPRETSSSRRFEHFARGTAMAHPRTVR